jgi:hypothetical protein
MSTLILPTFIEKNTNSHTFDSATDSIKLGNIKFVKDVAQFLKTFIDKTQVGIFLNDQGKFKKNVMIIYNDELLPHEKIDKAELERGSTIELMVQFAGG